MTHQYTKLADELEVIRQSFREMSHADRNPNWFTDGPRAATAHRLMWQRKGLEVADSIDEAASILRAAASVDVAGLMELAAKAIYDQWADQLGWVEWVPGGNSLNQDEARSIARAALESALRMALAAREGFVLVPVEPTWEMTKAAIPALQKQDLVVGDISVVYAAMLAAAPKGTP